MEGLAYLAVGVVAGAILGPRLRSALLEVTTAGYRVADAVSAQTSEQWQSVGAFFAEAREKARRPRPVASAEA